LEIFRRAGRARRERNKDGKNGGALRDMKIEWRCESEGREDSGACSHGSECSEPQKVASCRLELSDKDATSWPSKTLKIKSDQHLPTSHDHILRNSTNISDRSIQSTLYPLSTPTLNK